MSATHEDDDEIKYALNAIRHPTHVTTPKSLGPMSHTYSMISNIGIQYWNPILESTIGIQYWEPMLDSNIESQHWI